MIDHKQNYLNLLHNIYCDWDLDGIQDPNSSAAGTFSNLIDGLIFARI